MTYEAALKCAHPGCEFVALSKAGLTNHTRQKHQQPQLAQCAHCHRTFHHQGLLNHQRFCPEIPGNCIHTTTHFSLACITPLFHKNRGVQTAWMDGWCVCMNVCVCVCVMYFMFLLLVARPHRVLSTCVQDCDDIEEALAAQASIPQNVQQLQTLFYLVNGASLLSPVIIVYFLNYTRPVPQ